MILAMAGFDYTTSSLEEREQLALTKTEMKEMLSSISERPDVEGCAYVSTCGRGELYLFCGEAVDAAGLLAEKLAAEKDVLKGSAEGKGSGEGENFQKEVNFRSGEGSTEEENFRKEEIPRRGDGSGEGEKIQKRRTNIGKKFRTRYGRDAVDHLFHLACGMRSQIYGEDQILAQLKQSLELAREAQSVSGVLDRLFLSAIAAGKKVKSSVHLTAVPTSVADRMLEMLESRTEIRGKNCLVIGNGEIGRLCAAKLLEAGAAVTVTVRNYRTREVVIPVGCQIIDYRERFRIIPSSDVIVSATTSPHFTLPYTAENPLSDGRERWLFDLALPRDISPEYGNVPGLHLLGLDEVSAGDSGRQTDASCRAEEILAAEEENFFHWLDFRAANQQTTHIGELAAKDVTGRVHKRVRKALETQDSACMIETIYSDAVKKVVDNLMYDMRERLPEEQWKTVVEAMEQAALARAADKNPLKPDVVKPEAPSGLRYFPLFLDTEEKTVLFYGAGKVALRRVNTLLRFSCRMLIISPEAGPELLHLSEKYPCRIRYEKKRFEADALMTLLADQAERESGKDPCECTSGKSSGSEVMFVVAATDDRGVNHEIGAICRAFGMPVSVADKKEESTCFFPGIAVGGKGTDRTHIVAGVSSDGEDHFQTAEAVRKITGLLNIKDEN